MLQSYTEHVQELKTVGNHFSSKDTLPHPAAEENIEATKEKENDPLSSKHDNAFGQLDRVLLITHKELISLYAGAGYQLIGSSKVEHGPELWYEMVRFL